MKKYRITVNGKSYEVEVEDLGGSGAVSAPVQVTAQPSSVSKPAPKPQAPASKPVAKQESAPAPKAVPQGAEIVEAPMPGTVLDIKVSEGQTVEEGQVLVILEAMKMENEIVAPRAGRVSAINVANGASVNAGDPLISLE